MGAIGLAAQLPSHPRGEAAAVLAADAPTVSATRMTVALNLTPRRLIVLLRQFACFTSRSNEIEQYSSHTPVLPTGGLTVKNSPRDVIAAGHSSMAAASHTYHASSDPSRCGNTTARYGLDVQAVGQQERGLGSFV